jgi:hypothetical protein
MPLVQSAGYNPPAAIRGVNSDAPNVDDHEVHLDERAVIAGYRAIYGSASKLIEAVLSA